MLSKQQFNQKCMGLAAFFIIAAIFFLPFTITGKSIAVVLALVCVLGSGNWKIKISQIAANPVAWSALLLFLMFVLGVFYSEAPFKESLDILKKYSRLLYIPLFITIFIANPKWVGYLFSVFIASCLLVVLSGFISVSGLIDIAALFHRSTHNTMFPFMISDFFLALSIFFLAHYFCEDKTRWRWFYLASLSLMAFYNLVISDKRTGYITLSILAIVFLYQRLNRKQFLTGVIALIFLLGSLFAFSNNFRQGLTQIYQTVVSLKEHTFASRFSGTSTGIRIVFLEKSFELWKEAPVFGHGTGSFKQAYIQLGGPNQNGNPVAPSAPLTTPHNEYANIAVQLGVVGLGLFCFFLLISFRNTFYLPKLHRYCAQGLLVAFIFGNFSGSYLFYSSQGDFFVIFCAALFSQLALRRAEQRTMLTSPIVRCL